MRDNLADVAGVPRTVIIKDKEYIVSQLTIDDMAEFENYIKGERIKTLISATRGLDPLMQKELIKEAMSESTDSELQTMKGVRFLLWRMLKNNKGIPPLEKMGELVMMDNLPEVMGIVQEGGLETENPPELEIVKSDGE